LDLALLSSVSAKVMRRRGVSNDLRLRGDEWPLLSVVKGLSVVVATVVDEASIAAPSALLFRSYLCGAQTWPLRLGCSANCCVAARRCERVRALRNRLIAQQCGLLCSIYQISAA